MNKHISETDLAAPKVTTGPLSGSRKIYARPEAAPDLRVPLREIALTEAANAPPVLVYDPSGPFTDPDVVINVEQGLSRARIEWVRERGGVEEYEGRPIKPVDNGNATGKHLARNFPNTHRPLRALDGQPVKRLADYLGALRTVVFCTEDLQLIKGPARARRRFIDLLLAQTQPDYLPLLQRYMHTVRARNALLKQRTAEEAALESFSQELVKLGNEIIRARRELVPKFSPLARLAYRRISNDAEELRIEYAPCVKNDFAVELAHSRVREKTFRATLVGPHRDDLQLLLNEKSAAQFGSEGQKRTLAIALKMAQAEFLAGIHGSAPILLIDDVMGELDVKRRSGFLPLLAQARRMSGQVFMTCTEENWPTELGKDLQRWQVQAGNLKRF